jgi:hypothetical protein
MSGMNIAETRAPQDGRISLNLNGRPVDFRVATQPTIHGENIVLRILDREKSIISLEQMKLPKHVMNTLSLMVNAGYLKMHEVPGIPRLPKTPAITIYAPLGVTPVDPDAVLVSGTPGRLMLLHEAATRALDDRAMPVPLLGRPTCMAIPAALSSGIASSFGCIGNRIYTGISDEEFYTVIAGKHLAAILAELDTIASANAALSEYHSERRASLATA